MPRFLGIVRFVVLFSATLVTASAQGSSAEPILLYPQLALGGGFEATLVLSNGGDEDWSGRVELHGADFAGLGWNLNGEDQSGESSFEVSLPPGATAKFVLTLPDSTAISGWIEVHGPRVEELAPSFFYRLTQGRGSTTTLTAQPAEAFLEGLVPVERSVLNRIDTGIALRIRSQRLAIADAPIAPIDLLLIDGSGTAMLREEALPGALFLSEIFPGLPGEFLGSLRIRSRTGLYGVAIRQDFDVGGIRLASTSPRVSTRPNCEGEVSFADHGLESAVRKALGLGSDRSLTCEAAFGLTTLDASRRQIGRLEGVEAFENLRILDLEANQIVDLAPLSGLAHLEILNLSNQGRFEIDITVPTLDDLTPISGLINLRELMLDGNNLEDVSALARMNHLETLSLDGNSIRSFAGLHKRQLRRLSLDGNGIRFADLLSFAPLVEELSLRRNLISNLLLVASLRRLKKLELERNEITDLRHLSELAELEALGLDNNRIVDLSPLATLTRLRELRLNSNRVSDLSPLRGLTQLRLLEASRNELTNLQGLEDMRRLEHAFLAENNISDISHLAGLSEIRFLILRMNRVDLISPLKRLQRLSNLDLSINRVSDLTPLVDNLGFVRSPANPSPHLNIAQNPLDEGDCGDLEALRARGVGLTLSASLPCIRLPAQ